MEDCIFCSDRLYWQAVSFKVCICSCWLPVVYKFRDELAHSLIMEANVVVYKLGEQSEPHTYVSHCDRICLEKIHGHVWGASGAEMCMH